MIQKLHHYITLAVIIFSSSYNTNSFAMEPNSHNAITKKVAGDVIQYSGPLSNPNRIHVASYNTQTKECKSRYILDSLVNYDSQPIPVFEELATKYAQQQKVLAALQLKATSLK